MTATLLLLAVAVICQIGCTLLVGAEVQRRLQNLSNRMGDMDQVETQNFADLNTKLDALSDVVGQLVTLTTTEAQQLKDALAANDSAGVVAAQQALLAKVDAISASAVAALTPPTPTS